MYMQSPELMSSLEEQLQRSLRPVQPNPVFINRLQHHLVTPTTALAEKSGGSHLAIGVAFSVAVGLLAWWIIRQFR
jgi:hypothetical protein